MHNGGGDGDDDNNGDDDNDGGDNVDKYDDNDISSYFILCDHTRFNINYTSCTLQRNLHITHRASHVAHDQTSRTARRY